VKTTHQLNLRTTALGATALTVIAFLTVPAIAQGSSQSPLVTQMYNGQWPAQEDYAKFKDQLFFQRAVDAYMLTLPALNTIGMRDGSEAKFGAGYNVLPVWKDRMNAKTWVPTPNADIIYSMSYLDLTITSRWTQLHPKRAASWRRSGSSRASRSTPMLNPARL
jgi:hypothetical protein